MQVEGTKIQVGHYFNQTATMCYDETLDILIAQMLF